MWKIAMNDKGAYRSTEAMTAKFGLWYPA